MIWRASNCSSALDADCQTSMVNISPTLADTVIIIRPCVWIVCLLQTERERDRAASKNQLCHASIFISHWCHSKLICVHMLHVCIRSPQQQQQLERGHAPHCNEGELMSVGHQGPSGPFLAPVKTRAWLSLAHSTCSVTQAYNYSTCLSTGRSPQVTSCYWSMRATVGTARRCFLFTQPRNSLLIVSWIYSGQPNPFVTLLVFSNSTLCFSIGGRNPRVVFFFTPALLF